MHPKRHLLLTASLLLWCALAHGQSPGLLRAIGPSSLYFIENHGQVPGSARYYLRGRDRSVFVSDDALTFILESASGSKQEAFALRLEFVGARSTVSPRGEGPKGPSINLFTGGQDKWRTGLPTYSHLVYSDLWPGIDLALIGDTQSVKYEFRVKPGADPGRIRLRYRGADSLRSEPSGDLAVETPLGTLRDQKPFSFQESNGRRIEVGTRYALAGSDDVTFGFALAGYDPDKPLIIDPAIFVYASYLGGDSEDRGSVVAVDGSGAAYISGYTTSSELSFPTGSGFGSMPGADTSYAGGLDVFVAKVLPSGAGLEYVTYIGGSGTDVSSGLAVDSAGRAYVTGYTNSGAQFPVVGGPDLSYNGGANDVFVLKLNASGTALLFSGFIGGTSDDREPAIALDDSGRAYITGLTYSTEATFPTGAGFGSLPGADRTYNGDADAFAVKVEADGSRLLYASYIGGGGFDNGYSIGVDAAGNAYVGGNTASHENTFPDGDGVGSIPGPNTTYAGGAFDAFVVKLAATGASFSYVAFVGGALEDRYVPGLTVSRQGSAWIAGRTYSAEDTFPTGSGFGSIPGFDRTYNGRLDAFVVKIDASGMAFDYATYIGGSGDDDGGAVASDGYGNVYFTGRTDSTESTFPDGDGFGDVPGPDTTYNGGPHDAFVVKLNAAGTGLVYATYIGGPGGGFYDELGSSIATDRSGNAYVVGYTTSASGFPNGSGFGALPGFDQAYNGGSADAFLVKISAGAQNPPYPEDPNTVAFWRFEEAAGTDVADETGNNPGVAIGATTIGTGKYGRARNYRVNQGDYIFVPDSPSLTNLSQLTIEAWVFPASCAFYREEIVEKGAQIEPYDFYNLGVYGCPGGDGTLTFHFEVVNHNQGPTMEALAQSSIRHPIGQWYYVAGTYDGVRARLYVNGVMEAASADVPGITVTTGDPLFIHSHAFQNGQSNGRMGGVIDEVRILRVARSQGEITSVYSGSRLGGLSIFPVSARVNTGGQITLTARGCASGYESYSWTLLPSSTGGSLSSASGSSVIYTAAQSAGDAVIQVSAECAAATTTTVHVQQGPAPEAVEVTLDHPVTEGQGTIHVTAKFSEPLIAAMVCIDSQPLCPAMEEIASSGGKEWTYALEVAPTPGGLGFGPHRVGVRGISLTEEWGPLSKKEDLQVTRTKVVVLLLNGYNFPSVGPHPEEWWEWEPAKGLPIACRIAQDVFHEEPGKCSKPAHIETESNCTAEGGPQRVCVVNTLDGRASIDVSSIKICLPQPGCPFSVWVPDNLTLLQRFIDDIPWIKEAEQLILIGHSYGGQIARAYATSHPGKVQGVITIDTPHNGVEDWEIRAKGLYNLAKTLVDTKCPCTSDYDDALPFFKRGSTSLSRYQKIYPLKQAPATVFYPIASQVKEKIVGLRAPEDLKFANSTIGNVQELLVGDSVHADDDIVPTASQRGQGVLEGDHVKSQDRPYDVVRVPAFSLAHITHFKDALHLAVIEDHDVWEGLYQSAIKPALSEILQASQTAKSPGLKASAIETSVTTTSARGPYRLIERRSGRFTPSMTGASIPLPVETSADLTLSVQATGANPHLVLHDPMGQPFTSAAADGRSIFYASGSRDEQVTQTLVVRKPAAGTWTLDIQVPDSGSGPNLPATGADWEAAVAVQSPISLTLSLPDLLYLAGDSLGLSVAVRNDGAGLAGLSVSAVITPDSSGSPATFPLYDDGAHGDGSADDGIYGGGTVLGNWTGADIAVTAFGSSPLGPFQRQGSAHITIDTAQATIHGPFVETATDEDEDGSYDFLGWSFPVQVAEEGSYSIVASLAAADGTVVSSAHAFVTATGAGDVETSLVFPGSEIYQGGQPGPYTLTDAKVFFASSGGERLVARADQLTVSSGPYWSWLNFERSESPTLVWLFPVIQQATASDNVILQWLVQDGNGATTVDLYYDTTGKGFDGTAIVPGLDATSGTMSYTWDLSALPEGVYFVYARLRNGDHSNAVYGGSIARLIDTDGDGITDSWEAAHGLNPSNPADALLDPDGDGLANLDEALNGTDPQAADTDGGGEGDHSELINRRDPMAPSDDVTGISLLIVTPGVGDSRGGDTVVVTGSGFQSGATVAFGGTPAASTTFINSTRLVVVTPAHTLGTVDVAVMNPGNSGSATKAGAFVFLCEFVEPPVAFNSAGSSPICPGQDLLLGASGLSGATFSWTGPNGFMSNLQNPVISQIGPAASGVYTVTMQVGSCSLQATTTATVRSRPTAVVSGSKLICPESSVSIQAALTGEAPWTLVWSDGFTQSGISASPASRSVSPGGDTTYSITSVSDAYCGGMASGAAAITIDGSCTMFHAVAPCRVVDTRGPAGDYGGPALAGGATRVFTLGGQCGIPASAKAVSLNVTVTGATQPGHLRLFPGGAPLPAASTINFTANQTRANNAFARLGTGATLGVFSGQTIGGTVQVVVDVNGYFE
jgi:pimeloyl-ACP methyl ester carboxylesterase